MINKLIFTVVIVLLIIACDKEITNEPQIKVSIIESEIGFSSNPGNAKIYINGRYSGFYTPDTLKNFNAGEYEVLLKRDLYRDTSFMINLNEREKKNIFIDYNTNQGMLGSIRCNSLPIGADIFINDSATGKKTPYTFTNIIPGNYSVKFELEDFREDSTIASVESKIIADAYLGLRDTSVFVNYETSLSNIPSDHITDVVVDRDGIIWMTSLDKGLIRFDGKNFEEFSLDLGINIYYMRMLKISGDEIIVASNDGIIRFNGSSYQIYNKDNSTLVSNYINDITIISNKLWIANENNVIQTDFISWKNYSHFTVPSLVATDPPKIDSSIVYKLGNVRFYNEIIACTYEGSFLLRNNNWQVFPTPTPQSKLTFPFQNSNGNLLYDNDRSLWIVRKNTLSNLKYNVYRELYNSGGTEDINELYIDRDGTKWLSTTAGLYRFTDWFLDRKLYVESMSELNVSNITAVVLDHYNNAWISTMGGGLLKLKLNSR